MRTDDSLSIGDVAQRAGIAASALRYWEELGLIRPKARVSGRRRYASSAVNEVGVIVFMQELGFTLQEVKRLLRHRSSSRAWRELAQRKVNELDASIEKAHAAKGAIEHALSCPKDNILECPNFWTAVGGVLQGKELTAVHRD